MFDIHESFFLLFFSLKYKNLSSKIINIYKKFMFQRL